MPGIISMAMSMHDITKKANIRTNAHVPVSFSTNDLAQYFGQPRAV